jgi:ABC-2 type transport system permease protein
MKILELVKKDLTCSFRNRFALGMTIVAPILMIGLIYFAFGGIFRENSETTMVRVGVVNADKVSTGGPLVYPLGEAIRSLFFDETKPAWINPSDYHNERAARSGIDQDKIDVAVILPEGFTKAFLADEQDNQIEIIYDSTQAAGALAVQNIVLGMLSDVAGNRMAIEILENRQGSSSQQIDPESKSELISLYPKRYAGFQGIVSQNTALPELVMVAPAFEITPPSRMHMMLGLMLAGQMAFLAFFSGSFSMVSILKEEEDGTLARLRTSTVGISSILTGKFVVVFLSVTLQSVVFIAAAHYVFNFNWGQPPAVVLALIGQVLVAAGLGVLLISFVRSNQQSGPILGGSLTLLGMLGGLFTSGFSMPEIFTKLAVFTPQGWVLKAWDISLSRQHFGEMVIPFAVLMILGVAMMLIGGMIFRRRFG